MLFTRTDKNLRDRAVAKNTLKWAILLISLYLFTMEFWFAVRSVVSGKWSEEVFFVWADQTIINATLVLMTILIMARNFRLILLPAAFAIGEFIYNSGILVFNFHEFLNRYELYHAILGRHETRTVNPQYGMLVLYITAALILFVLSCSKKHRTFDRLMGLMTALSILATLTLFHVFLVKGIDNVTRLEERTIAATFSDTRSTFLNNCKKVNINCSFVSYTDPTRDSVSQTEIDENIQRTLKDIAKDHIELSLPYVWAQQTIVAKNTTFWVAGVLTQLDGMWLATSGADYTRAIEFESKRFTTTCLFAHVTWLIIFILLVTIHRKKNRKMVRQVLSVDSFT